MEVATAASIAVGQFAPDATDPRFKQLVQAGLVHERYWEQNVLRWGGSHGPTTGPDGPVRDLHSLNLGVATNRGRPAGQKAPRTVPRDLSSGDFGSSR